MAEGIGLTEAPSKKRIRQVEPFRTSKGEIVNEGQIITYRVNGTSGNFSGIAGLVGKAYVDMHYVLDPHVFPAGDKITYRIKDLTDVSVSEYSDLDDGLNVEDPDLDARLNIEEYKKRYERGRTKPQL